MVGPGGAAYRNRFLHTGLAQFRKNISGRFPKIVPCAPSGVRAPSLITFAPWRDDATLTRTLLASHRFAVISPRLWGTSSHSFRAKPMISCLPAGLIG